MTIPAGRVSNYQLLFLGLGVAGLVVLFAIVIAASPAGGRWNGDVDLFYQHAGAFLDGSVSRTEFLAWYPPFVLAPITAPRLLAGGLPMYTFLFALEMALAAGALVVVTGQTALRALSERSSTSTMAWVVGLTLLTGLVLPLRFDVLPALATALGFLAISLGAPLAAGALVGLGADLKLWPAVILPTILLWYWSQGDQRSAIRALTGFVAVVVIGFGVYLTFQPASPMDLVRFQGGRPLQLESLPASVIGLLAAAGVIGKPQVTFSDGSYNMLGSLAEAGIRITTIAEPLLILTALAAAAFCFRRMGRGGGDITPLAVALTASVLALILGNRVFSPQYMIWLLPTVAFLPNGYRVASAFAFTLTAFIFPLQYDQLIRMELLPEILLVARNGVLVGMWIAMIAWLLRAPVRGSAVHDHRE